MAIIDALQCTALCGMWGMVPTDDLIGGKYWSSKWKTASCSIDDGFV